MRWDHGLHPVRVVTCTLAAVELCRIITRYLMRLIYSGFHSISILIMLRIPACLCYDLVPFDRFGPFLGPALCSVVYSCACVPFPTSSSSLSVSDLLLKILTQVLDRRDSP